jgi:hypothetical protein
MYGKLSCLILLCPVESGNSGLSCASVARLSRAIPHHAELFRGNLGGKTRYGEATA